MLYLFYDTETTSAERNTDIVSIAIIATKKSSNGFVPAWGGNMEASSFVSLCKPKKRVTPDARLVHGITDNALRNAPPFKMVWSQLVIWIQRMMDKTQLKRHVLVAHNGRGFDDIVLSHNLFRYCDSKTVEDNLRESGCAGFVDTLKLLRGLYETKENRPINTDTGRKSFTLTNCHKLLCGSAFDGAHDALADTLALIRVCNAEGIQALLCSRLLCNYTISLVDHVKSLPMVMQHPPQRKDPQVITNGDQPVLNCDHSNIERFDSDTLSRLCLKCMCFVISA